MYLYLTDKDVYTLFISFWWRIFAAVIHWLDFAENQKSGTQSWNIDKQN